MAQRRRKTSPLRDVAGLLRSFDYAAATAAPGRVAASPGAGERRAALLERFRVEAGQRFLEAYRGVLHAAPRRWAPEAAEASLLDLFLLEKAAYEVRYEASNRPAWIDLRLKLHCPKAEYTDFTVVIILNVGGTVLGAVVDAVADVVALAPDAIKAAPQFESQVDSAFVTGIATLGDRMLIMMDIESLLSSAEMGLVAQVAR